MHLGWVDSGPVVPIVLFLFFLAARRYFIRDTKIHRKSKMAKKRNMGKAHLSINSFCDQYRSGFGVVAPVGYEHGISFENIRHNFAEAILHVPLAAGILTALVCALAYQYLVVSPYAGVKWQSLRWRMLRVG